MGVSVVDGVVAGVVCAVGVESVDGLVNEFGEVGTVEDLCLVDEDRNERTQQVADTRVATGVGDLAGLYSSEPAGHPCVADTVELVHATSQGPPHGGFARRAVPLGTQERGHGSVPVDLRVQASLIHHRHQHSSFGVEGAAFEFVGPQPVA